MVTRLWSESWMGRSDCREGGRVGKWAGDSQHFGPILSAMSKPTQKNSFFFNKFLRLRAKSELAPL